MAGLIPHNQPQITPEDREAVDAVLRSGWIAQGEQVLRLEQHFVERMGGGGACAVASGTAALFLALRGLGVRGGARVAVPTYSCSALLNAVFMAGGSPIVVDVTPDTFCLDVDGLARQAPGAEFAIAVHAFGAAAPVRRMVEQGLGVVEDCCQCLGGALSGEPLGTCGAAAVFSFYATKIVTGGQGGLVWSRNPGIVEAARDYRQFDGRERYEPRFNLQMTDMQAAMINSQLSRLERIRCVREEIARTYLRTMPEFLSVQADRTPQRMWQRFVVLAPDPLVRDALLKHMKERGVGCIVPVERFELLHRYLALDPEGYPAAERLADTTVSLPIHAGMTAAEVATVSTALSEFEP